MLKFDPTELPINYDGLSQNQRRQVREEYIRIQKGKCYYCDSSLTGPPEKSINEKKITARLFPRGFYNNPVHLHHNHDTGMTIGAVHAHCNAVLWEYYDE